MPLPMEEFAPVSVPARVFTITASSLEVPRSDSADSSVPGGPDSPLSESHPFSPSSPFSPQTHRNSDGPVTLGLSIGRRAMLSEETPPQFTRSLSDPDTPGHDAHPFRTLSADCSDSSQISVSTRASSVAVSPRSSLNSPLPSALPSPTVDVGSLMVSPSKRPSFQYSDNDSRPPSSTELTALYDIPSSGRYFEPITESPQHSRNSSITSLLDEATQLPAKSSDDVNKYDATSFTAFLRTVALPLALLIASVFRHWGQAIMHFVFVGDYNPELHSHIDTPYFLKKNPYILNHYRVHYSKRNCVRSMCRCHNETANIFSHTVGFALCALLYYTNSEWLASIPHSAGDHFAFTLFFVSALYCMGASTFFHTFGCHSLKTYQFWLAQDIGGTFFMVLILMYMIIYFLFFDSTFWTVVYGVAFALPIFIFVPRIVEKSMLNKKNAELGQKCSEPEVGAKLDKNAIAYGKNGAAIGLSCVGLLVLLFLHVMARRGMYNPHLNGAIHYLSRHVFTCFSAVVVYLTRFPESILPGKFDLLLNSHNLWHVHGVVSLVYQYNLLVELFMYKQSFSN